MPNNKKDCKRNELIKAAREEFMTKGYDGARIISIADKVGVSHPLIHYHFKSKKEIFRIVLQEQIDVLQKATLVFWDNAGNDLFEKLEKGISRHFDYIWKNSDYLRFQFRELERHPELFIKIRDIIMAGLKQITKKIQKELNNSAKNGKSVPMDAHVLLEDIFAVNLFFLLNEPILRKKVENFDCEKEYFEQRKQENIRLILNRLRPETQHGKATDKKK